MLHLSSTHPQGVWQSLLERIAQQQQQQQEKDQHPPGSSSGGSSVVELLASMVGTLCLQSNPAAKSEASLELRTASITAAQKRLEGCKSRIQSSDNTQAMHRLVSASMSVSAVTIALLAALRFSFV